jgi:hypothetical protein
MASLHASTCRSTEGRGVTKSRHPHDCVDDFKLALRWRGGGQEEECNAARFTSCLQQVLQIEQTVLSYEQYNQ